MTKYCAICMEPLKDGDEVVVGVRSVYRELPSSTTWAIEKPEKFLFINHASCEELV